ncbi:uncharacterized protein METZ01_LOCUS154366 [marine metagenome]|uniref:Uncharacterized protein n=1 Tax=marine metagenome TaxID=408172 RepID=A0A382AK64_9ZZZZ
MSIFEYVMVLVSIIVGLGITHMLKGLVKIIQDKNRNLYWIHLVWSFNIFFTLIFFWWWQYKLIDIQQWTFALYIFVIVFALIYYILSTLLFPEKLLVTYKEYYFDKRKWIFGILLLSIIIDYFDTLNKGMDYMKSLGFEYQIQVVVFSIMAMIAIRTKNEIYHALFALINFAYQIQQGFRYYSSF